jgi:uncharacterized membrane protein
VTGTFINATNNPLGDVRYQLTVPNGWQVTPTRPQPPVVAAHQAVRLSWRVTAPYGTAPTPRPR